MLAKEDLQLWQQEIPSEFDELDLEDDDGKNLNELNYSINGIDLNMIFKMQTLYQ